MRQSKAEIYLHFVWQTWKRTPYLTGDTETAVHRCLQQEVQNLRCHVVALNGMPDHVHLFVKVPATVSASQIMQQIKGISSKFATDALGLPPGKLWQEGYGVFSVSPKAKEKVIEYVRNQKQHHANGSLHTDWEETEEPYIPCIVPP